MSVLEVAGFPITAEVNLSQTFRHEDIPYSVSNHGRRAEWPSDRPHGTYCYYVYVHELMLSPEQFADFWLEPKGEAFKHHVSYDYNAPWADADWHCGVTWYSKEAGFDGEPRSVKIGCDYAHYWDEGHHYDLESVKFDALNTVKALQAMYQFYRRDPWNGVWLPPSQMVEHDGVLYSPEGLKASLASRAEWAEKAK